MTQSGTHPLATSSLYRFAQIGQVAAGFFHDAANLVGALRLHTEALAELTELADAHPSPRFKQLVTRQLQALQSLDSLITAARLPLVQATPTEVVMAALLEDVVQVVAFKSRRAGVKIEVVGPAQPVVVVTAETTLFQVVLNLLTNAIEAYPRPDLKRDDQVVEVAYGHHRTQSWVKVSDWGRGMTSEQLAALFQPFASSKTGAGRGVGLYLSKQLVTTVLQGELDCESQCNRGSTFTLTLPSQLPPVTTASDSLGPAK
jgi:two-component system NtrC family sensor kinase